jgi:GDP-D-mannose dehydratase
MISGERLAKTAFITGVAEQSGSYLAAYLLTKGYDVQGIKRRMSLFNTEGGDHIYQNPLIPDGDFTLHYGDLTDAAELIAINVQKPTLLTARSLGAKGLEFSRSYFRADSSLLIS